MKKKKHNTHKEQSSWSTVTSKKKSKKKQQQWQSEILDIIWCFDDTIARTYYPFLSAFYFLKQLKIKPIFKYHLKPGISCQTYTPLPIQLLDSIKILHKTNFDNMLRGTLFSIKNDNVLYIYSIQYIGNELYNNIQMNEIYISKTLHDVYLMFPVLTK